MRLACACPITVSICLAQQRQLKCSISRVPLLIGKRRQQRTKMVVPVRLWIRDAAGVTRCYLAHTLDVSDHGVRMGGFNGTLNSGQLIEVQYRHKRARFRVVWI